MGGLLYMKVKGMLRGLLLAYGLTGIMLLLLAFLLFRFDLKENMVSMGIVLVYILSCFLGGILAGKYARTRKYLWGMAVGAVYFLLLIAVSWLSLRQLDMSVQHILTTLCMCLAGGTLGGMIS